MTSKHLLLPRHRDLFYGGTWHRPLAGAYYELSSPGSGEPLGHAADGSSTDVDAAVESARKAFREWKNVPPLERAKALRRFAGIVRENARELATLDAIDCGNPVRAMIGDAEIAAAQIDFFAGLVTEMKGASIPMGPGRMNVSVREPLGVVARIIPFNHPFMFAAGKSAAPIAAGNTVVVKPPEQAPLSALRLAELVEDVFPPGVFNVVTGAGSETGAALVAHRGGREGRADRQRGGRPRGHAQRGRHDQARAAGARRQERTDRLCGRASGSCRRCDDRGNEFRVVRAIVRIDEPRVSARRHPRSRAR
jgi:betaine-aldehyde dehydrogenase